MMNENEHEVHNMDIVALFYKDGNTINLQPKPNLAPTRTMSIKSNFGGEDYDYPQKLQDDISQLVRYPQECSTRVG